MDRSLVCDRSCMRERAGMADDDGRPPAVEQGVPRIADALGQRPIGLAFRPVDLEGAAGQGCHELRGDGRELVERVPIGDPHIGLPPALVNLDRSEPCRRRDRLGGRQGAKRRTRDDAGIRGEDAAEDPAKTHGLVMARLRQRRVGPAAVADPGPGCRSVADEDDLRHRLSA
jgi:hypothetical protein